LGEDKKKAPGLLKIISPTFNNKYAETHDRGRIPLSRFGLFYYCCKASEMAQRYKKYIL